MGWVITTYIWIVKKIWKTRLQSMIHHDKYIPWPWGQVQGHTIHCPIPSTWCDLCTCKVLTCYVEMHLQENTFFDRDCWAKVTQNIARYPLHHVSYAPAKFEIVTSKIQLQENGQKIKLQETWQTIANFMQSFPDTFRLAPSNFRI